MFGKAVIALSVAATALAQTFSIATPVSTGRQSTSVSNHSHRPFDPFQNRRTPFECLLPFCIAPTPIVHVADNSRPPSFSAVSLPIDPARAQSTNAAQNRLLSPGPEELPRTSCKSRDPLQIAHGSARVPCQWAVGCLARHSTNIPWQRKRGVLASRTARHQGLQSPCFSQIRSTPLSSTARNEGHMLTSPAPLCREDSRLPLRLRPSAPASPRALTLGS